MAAVVASKVKRKRQMALEGKLGHQESLKETQLHQRRLATASKEAAEKRKAAQYYRQVELQLWLISLDNRQKSSLKKTFFA